jgi:hypothetical protein
MGSEATSDHISCCAIDIKEQDVHFRDQFLQ